MTKEEAFKNLVALNAVCGQKDFFDKEFEEALLVAEKALEQEPCEDALEQEPILDKIRAEITNIHLTDTDGHNNNWYREPQAIINDALWIIDKYKAESEDKEWAD